MSRATGRIVMENQTLRWSTPRTLNDPYDLQFDLRTDIDREAVKSAALPKLWNAFYGDQPVPVGNRLGAVIREIREVFPKLTREEFDRQYGEAMDESLSGLERGLPEIQQEIRSIMADSKLLCLTEAPDNKLMWAHYAEHNQGAVLGFRSVQGLDSPYESARPVEYLDEMPLLIDNDFLADMASGQVLMDAQAIIDRMIYTKSSEWAYERERRISASSGRDAAAPHEDIPFNALELSAVIVGCRMPEDDRTTFVEMTKRLYPHASILQASKAEKKYQLEIEPL
jgi:hypothetical protein